MLDVPVHLAWSGAKLLATHRHEIGTRPQNPWAHQTAPVPERLAQLSRTEPCGVLRPTVRNRLTIRALA